jgi:tRNA-splicing ligase RtcB
MNVIQQDGYMPIKMWTNGVSVEESALNQLYNTAKLPFIFKHLAVMPDVHLGKGSTIGSVIPTINAVIPAAVGVDIGCGMMAVKTSLTAKDLPDNLYEIRTNIESAAPHGSYTKGAWQDIPKESELAWHSLKEGFDKIIYTAPKLEKTNNINHLGTLGGGNHFIELCLDESDYVWVMLHSGSRGIGNAIGRHFIELAKKEMQKYYINLPDIDLAYLPQGSEHFDDYIFAVNWAQNFASLNRKIMMENVIQSLRKTIKIKFTATLDAINCHHNYVTTENHYGRNVFITRKGAVRAREGDLGIIPGSMGAKSFIVRGLGNKESFNSCSHGAGRVMSRTKAKELVNLDEHLAALKGVECRMDEELIDETPSAYKDIDKVMNAQKDLVEIIYTLKQIVCVKG